MLKFFQVKLLSFLYSKNFFSARVISEEELQTKWNAVGFFNQNKSPTQIFNEEILIYVDHVGSFCVWNFKNQTWRDSGLRNIIQLLEKQKEEQKKYEEK